MKHMNHRTSHANGRTIRWALTLFVVISLILPAASVAMAAPAAPQAPAAAAWTAYNDCAWASGQPNTNITTYGSSGSGLLKNYATGANTTVTAALTTSGTVATDSTGAETDSGKDAYNTFNGKASMVGVVRLATSASYVDLTLSGLDPAKTYTFATSANRQGGTTYLDRVSKFSFSGADAATNASTSGVTGDALNVIFSTGENTATGFVARWTGIQPGTDGIIKVRAASNGATTTYAFSVFLLQEEVNPTITIAGTPLSAFGTQPGVPSAEQFYTVSGSNLTADIIVTAPADFEVSKTSGSAFASSVTLAQIGGTVSATPIYVRFSRATEGASSGDITHTSAGAATQNISVSGTASTASVYCLH